MLTPWQVDVKLGPWRKGHKGQCLKYESGSNRFQREGPVGAFSMIANLRFKLYYGHVAGLGSSRTFTETRVPGQITLVDVSMSMVTTWPPPGLELSCRTCMFTASISALLRTRSQSPAS